MVIADGGACAWLFIETRATRAYQAHAPKIKRNAPKKNFALARQVGLRSSSVLLFSKPLLVIADKRLFINSTRVNFGALFIYLAEKNFPKLSIRTQQRIHDRTAKSFAKIRVFDNAYPLARFALIFLNFYVHPDHAPFIYPYCRIKI
jgi:hypothetical protein